VCALGEEEIWTDDGSVLEKGRARQISKGEVGKRREG